VLFRSRHWWGWRPLIAGVCVSGRAFGGPARLPFIPNGAGNWPRALGGCRAGRSGPAEHLVQLNGDVDEVAFAASGNNLKGPQQETGERGQRRLELRLAKR